jgi:hypothetical protein
METCLIPKASQLLILLEILPVILDATAVAAGAGSTSCCCGPHRYGRSTGAGIGEGETGDIAAIANIIVTNTASIRSTITTSSLSASP